MDNAKACRQCGTCCRKGGPALHREDMRLLEEGVLQLQDLCTFRSGELVRDLSNGNVVPLPEEIVKIAAPRGSRPDDWTCRFLTEGNRCFIHESEPAECRALFCEDPSALLAMQGKETLNRKSILEGLHAPQWLMDCVAAHEERCAYPVLAGLASRMEKDGEARRVFLETVEFDRSYRELVMEKAGVKGEMLDFLFGRALIQTVIMFGMDARKNPDGSMTLVQMTRMPQ